MQLGLLQGFCLRTSLLLLLGEIAHAQLRIVAPVWLADEFRDTGGLVYGTTATFGAPYYGERVIGRLVYGESLEGRHHCTESDYHLKTAGQKTEYQDLVDVALVRRGGCTFVTKVLTAQNKGAHAVVVVDREESTLSAKEIQKVVMSNDGYGDKVKVPSVLISRFEGQKLIEAAKSGAVIVELVWDIPRNDVVVADFWMSSASQETSEFLTRFKDSAETLKSHLQFVPHFHVFSMPSDSGMNHLCLSKVDGCSKCKPSEPSKYCSPDPDGSGPITGAEVANEDLRRLCIWNVTARSPSVPNRARYSQEFWDYADDFFRECPVDGEGDKAFGFACSQTVMKRVGISAEQVLACVQANYEGFMDEQLEQVAWSPQALRLNGWRYSGPLDPETVLKALCAGFAKPPKECEELLQSYGGVSVMGGLPLSWGGLFTGISMLLVGSVGAFFYYRLHVTRSVRKVLREEVMLEVQTQMADYIPMEDSADQRATSRPALSF